jgi:hypothetical protein
MGWLGNQNLGVIVSSEQIQDGSVGSVDLSDTAIQTKIHAADSKTIANADEIGVLDSTNGWNLKKTTWASMKTEMSSAFDTSNLAPKDGTGTSGTWPISITGASPTLTTARTINGVSFNGSANITINAVDSTARIASSEKGVANGVATLGADSKIPSSQLPSYVDDVLEYANLAGFPVTGETGKIYVDLATNKTYRWSGTVYVYITSGAVDSVAGKTGVVTLVKGDVGLGNVDNTSDASKPVSTATQTELNLKANLASPTFTGTVSGITKTMVGLGNVDNTADSSKNVFSAATLTTARTLTIGATGKTFNGSANVSWTLAELGVPSTTGSGASGNWGINITGSSASCTGNAATATTASAVSGSTVSCSGRISTTEYVHAAYLNMSHGSSDVNFTAIPVDNGDGYLRKTGIPYFNIRRNRVMHTRETNGGTCAHGVTYSIYTGGGAITMYLPLAANTTNGDTIRFVNLLNQWATYNFTLARADANTRIHGLNENLICDKNIGGFDAVCAYHDGTAYWVIV